MSILDRLLAEEQEYVQKLAACRADIASFEGRADDVYRPVEIGDFLNESGDFDWLLGGLIAKGSVTMVAAEPRVGKSTVLTQIALALGSGRDEILGFRIPKRARTLYVMAEGSRHAFRGRLRTQCESMDLDPRSIDWCIQPDRQMSFWLVDRYVERIVASSGADLVIMDTMGYFHGGDENDSAEWKKRIMAPLRAMGAKHGCSFILVHHYGKMVPGKSRWERGRGSSAMFGDVDHWVGIEKVPLLPDEQDIQGEERVRLESRRELFVEKNRYGRDDYSVKMEFWKERGTFVLEGQADRPARPGPPTLPPARDEGDRWWVR